MNPTILEVKKRRPFLRGRFHEAAFFYSLGASTLLIALARDLKSFLALSIYGICLAGLFGISSLYHRIDWNQSRYALLSKLDHAMIFIFIAGTVTPICLLGLSPETGHRLLFLFWGAALFGVLKELFWKTSKWVSAILYISMGWIAGPYISEFAVALGALSTWLLIVGGLIYTLGAIIYAAKWPNPFPEIFGYHEIFHILVMIASVFHFIAIYRLIAA